MLIMGVNGKTWKVHRYKARLEVQKAERTETIFYK